MWLSSIRACESRMAGALCSSVDPLLMSVQLVSLLNATKPPSTKGTINCRFAVSWPVAPMEADNSRDTRIRILLIILVTPLDDREFDVVCRFEPDETYRRICLALTAGKRGQSISLGLFALRSVARNAPISFDVHGHGLFANHRHFDRFGNYGWRARRRRGAQRVSRMDCEQDLKDEETNRRGRERHGHS